jgi:PKHD-type hydroxylase
MNYIFPPFESNDKSLTAYWEDFLTDDQLNEILSVSEWSNLNPAKVGTYGKGVIDASVRETDISWYTRNLDNGHIWEKLAHAATQVNRRFFRYDLTGFYEPAQLGYYNADKKSHYTWHTDWDVTNMSVPRKLSMVLQLNNPSEFEGGELQVKINSDNPTSLELRRGRAWFFPSFLLHRVTPITKGERKSLVLWITGPEFK